jgi:hypothetical protein
MKNGRQKIKSGTQTATIFEESFLRGVQASIDIFVL